MLIDLTFRSAAEFITLSSIDMTPRIGAEY